jgi:predicted transcriptional regulator
LPQTNEAPGESIYLDLLQALAASRKRSAAQAPELARVLGTTAQFVVAKLQPLVRGGLVSRSSADTRGCVYAISEEGRDYLIRRRPSQDRRR